MLWFEQDGLVDRFEYASNGKVILQLNGDLLVRQRFEHGEDELGYRRVSPFLRFISAIPYHGDEGVVLGRVTGLSVKERAFKLQSAALRSSGTNGRRAYATSASLI